MSKRAAAVPKKSPASSRAPSAAKAFQAKPTAGSVSLVSKEISRRAYRTMLEARLLEEKLAALYR